MTKHRTTKHRKAKIEKRHNIERQNIEKNIEKRSKKLRNNIEKVQKHRKFISIKFMPTIHFWIFEVGLIANIE